MRDKSSEGSNLGPGNRIQPKLNLLAWEITRSCNLSCAHCRASAAHGSYEGELSTEECLRLIDDILEVGRPVLILSGGEPLLRPDFFTIAKYAASRGLKVAVGTNGTLITKETAARAKEAAIARIAISLDFPSPELHDKFRGVSGAFEAAIRGIENARQAGIAVQINSSITKLNAPHLEELLSLALRVGAVAFHPFLLVPTGRGKGLREVELSPEEHERILHWVYDKQVELGDKLFFKPTDAPHYFRIVRQRNRQNLGTEGGHSALSSLTRGCLAGIGFCFVSHRGRVQGCGYLDVEAGNIRERRLAKIWADSPLFGELRDLSRLKGKCGVCEYMTVCGGCRARAYEATGDWLGPEPYCIYQPGA